MERTKGYVEARTQAQKGVTLKDTETEGLIEWENVFIAFRTNNLIKTQSWNKRI